MRSWTPLSSAKESYYTLFAMLRGCCILFTTRLCLPTLSRQPEYISIVFDTKEMRREGGPLSRSRCGSAFGSWPPRAGTGWSRRLTQGLASSGLPGSLSTSDWFPPAAQDAVSNPFRFHRANINNTYWLGQGCWLTHPQMHLIVYLAKATG